MELILWRHATAEEAGHGSGADAARALTRRGEREAERVAEWLRARLPADIRVLASPATRTRQTAAALDPRHEVVPAIATGAGAEDVIAAAGWPDAPGTVVVVGHQPTLGRVAARILGGVEADWTIRKGALVWIVHRDRGTWLRAAIGPEDV